MDFWNSISKEHQEMLKSWVKVFLASIAALTAVGETNIPALLFAGVTSVIPLVITWLDPNDLRFGRVKELPKPAKKTASKPPKKK
jgi:hypothetical protein